MNHWIEERCETIRLALRIGHFPGDADIWRLADWLGSTVRIRHEDVETPSCTSWGLARKAITLPRHLMGQQLNRDLTHELGHALLTVGMGQLLRQVSPGIRQIERLAALWDAQDESRAEYFVRSWYMPSHLAKRYRNGEDLADAANVDQETAGQRIRELSGQVVTIEHAPDWCAHWQYHTISIPNPQSPMLYVARRGHSDPAYVFPVGSSRDAEEGAMQTNADLIALTSDEFEGKYAPFRAEIIERPPFDIKALYAWSRQAA